MKSMIRTLCTTVALVGGTLAASAVTASAQGYSHKEQKVERKIDRKVQKAEHRHVNRVVNRTNRARVLCDDGTWSYASIGCGGHGGLASRQYHPVPHPSTHAVLHANPHSAVAHRAYANGISAGAVARCSDGTYWHAGNHVNACYRHGGVAHWF